MKSSLFLGAMLAGATSALPTFPAMTQALSGRSVANGIIQLAILIAELRNNEKNAYDPSMGSSYVVTMSTYAGTDCSASVQSASSYQGGLPNHNAKFDELSPISGGRGSWNVCYRGGRQYFHDENIGDFSITFSEAGGVNGNKKDGLHTPILQVANINNWEPINVAEQAAADGNKLCQINGGGDGKLLSWSCGIPKIGKSFFDVTNTPPITAKTYAKGWCGLHFVQHQIPKTGGKYGMSVLIRDANGEPIGQLGNPYTLGEDSTAAQLYKSGASVTSLLPYTLDVSVGSLDSDPVSFAYAGQTWDTGANNGAHACKVGKYDSNYRQGDCGFTC